MLFLRFIVLPHNYLLRNCYLQHFAAVRKCLCNQGLRVKLCRSSTEQINDNHQSLQSIINSAVRDSILDGCVYFRQFDMPMCFGRELLWLPIRPRKTFWISTASIKIFCIRQSQMQNILHCTSRDAKSLGFDWPRWV
jgi:hypothetical protein